ncbi:enoyl-CoA hydratase/isomerase family protein [Frankia sp. CNm7]|uniref:Enoyl-CoA hydratase/isomerase family protein n=1 Tax=Frankia nepalensis TaxID=1836974 RepID=A0A937RNE7_9ACTN|nr:enoyl-CoA hydratase-related protein [Frankia nepalensis]MBL7497753.1 enoyl-CoA hydratase/isomerase family protein [Frankia nepalensis]MBL7512013.1 enoyl-CoA hydratase/isomerase family protein [Frankia nepalensis]MBL7520351.1 enoyl-CoA hydratase/isomerase family protein [Frankia nepalensis]MBL7632065.1 enoyl-CoA hydratase/isomerase family protein [Frankia nepalensis]
MPVTVIETEEPRPGIVLVRLNRPDVLNAITAELIQGLRDVLRGIRDDSWVRAVVLTGAGRGFCAGLDLHGYGDLPGTPAAGEGIPQSGLRGQRHVSELVEDFRAVRAPIIAAVNGPAAGAGLSISLLCDLRLAAESASFHASFIRRGLSSCDVGISWLLPRAIGFARAADLLLTGGSVDARDAERIGLVSAVVPDEKLLDAALERATAIAQLSPFGVWQTKELLWANQEVAGLRAAVALEDRTQVLAGMTEDHREAVAAFLEKRPAAYRDR